MSDRGEEVPFTLADIDALDATLDERPDVALVVIDPVSAFIPGKVDDHRDAEVRGLLRPLAELAARRNIAVVLIKHLNKSDSGNAGNLVAGSRAYVNAARAAFLVGPDPTDKEGSGRCVMIYVKRNLTSRCKGLAYSKRVPSLAEQDEVLAHPRASALTGEQQTLLRRQLFRVEWEGETDVTDKDLARARRGMGEGSTTTRADEAAAWLKKFLAAKSRPAKEVFENGKQEQGFTERNLRDALRQLGGWARPKELGGEWLWGLPAPPSSCGAN